AADDRLAVFRHRHREDAVGVLLEAGVRLQLRGLAGNESRQLRDLDELVEPGGDEPLAVGGDRDAVDADRVRRARRPQLAGGDVIYSQLAAVAARGERAAIG